MTIKDTLKSIYRRFHDYTAPKQNPTGLKIEDIGGANRTTLDETFKGIAKINKVGLGIDRIGDATYMPLSMEVTGAPSNTRVGNVLFFEPNGDLVSLNTFTDGLKSYVMYTLLDNRTGKYTPISTPYGVNTKYESFTNIPVSGASNKCCYMKPLKHPTELKTWCHVRFNDTMNSVNHQYYDIDIEAEIKTDHIASIEHNGRLFTIGLPVTGEDWLAIYANRLSELLPNETNWLNPVQVINKTKYSDETPEPSIIRISDSWLGTDRKTCMVYHDNVPGLTSNTGAHSKSLKLIEVDDTTLRLFVTDRRYYVNTSTRNNRYIEVLYQLDIDTTTEDLIVTMSDIYKNITYYEDGFDQPHRGTLPNYNWIYYNDGNDTYVIRNDTGINLVKSKIEGFAFDEYNPLDLTKLPLDKPLFASVNHLVKMSRIGMVDINQIQGPIKPVNSKQAVSFCNLNQLPNLPTGYGRYYIDGKLDYKLSDIENEYVGFTPKPVVGEMLPANWGGWNPTNNLTYVCVDNEIVNVSAGYHNDYMSAYTVIDINSEFRVNKSVAITTNENIGSILTTKLRALDSSISDENRLWEIIKFNGAFDKAYLFYTYSIDKTTKESVFDNHFIVAEVTLDINLSSLIDVNIVKVLSKTKYTSGYATIWKDYNRCKPDSYAFKLSSENKWCISIVSNIASRSSGDSSWYGHHIVYDPVTNTSEYIRRLGYTASVYNRDYPQFVPALGFHYSSKVMNAKTGGSMVFGEMGVKTVEEFKAITESNPDNPKYFILSQVVIGVYSFRISTAIPYLVNDTSGVIEPATYDVSSFMTDPDATVSLEIALVVKDRVGRVVIDHSFVEDENTVVFGRLEIDRNGIGYNEIEKVTRIWGKRISTVRRPNSIVAPKGSWKEPADYSGWKK